MQKEKNQKSEMNRKTRFYLVVLLAGVVLTGWALYKNDNLKLNFFRDQIKSEEVPLVDQDNNTGRSSFVGNYLEGQLKNSDDLNLGNLKLTSSLGEIYIKTSRDFSALIGFDVLMTIDGTLDKFTLLNIEKRLEKDGYIQAQ
ncbi:MAG: hypothetical protein Q7S43_01635 [bacterium]|nr:hypothetical protein [bacterium]